jgi:ATP synthase protein I
MSDEHGKDGSFEERLRLARSRQGLDAPPPGKASAKVDTSAMSVGLRVGVEMVAALAVAVAIGLFLDRWLHTRPLMLVIFVLLGGAAGVLNVWRMFAPRGHGR